jgi:hypothetical protein
MWRLANNATGVESLRNEAKNLLSFKVSSRSILHERRLKAKLPEKGNTGVEARARCAELPAHGFEVSLGSVHPAEIQSVTENDFECLASTGLKCNLEDVSVRVFRAFVSDPEPT